jgi:hypothetical protein
LRRPEAWFPRDQPRRVVRQLAAVNLQPFRDFTFDYNLVAGSGDKVADQKLHPGV